MDLKNVKEFVKDKWNNKKESRKEERLLPVMKVGTNLKMVRILWGILIFSIIFGVYKNFTAVDKETIYEREVVEEKLIDTNAIESFVTKFAREYHAWGNTAAELTDRKQQIAGYLADGLVKLNTDAITTDCPVTAVVEFVDLWSLEEKENGEYDVKYSIIQGLEEDKVIVYEESAYMVNVHMDDTGDMVITRNPTICGRPEISGYMPEEKLSDGSVDGNTVSEIEEFLNTFFTIYPNATEKELAYYVRAGELDVIKKNYIYSGLVSGAYFLEGETVRAFISVRYLDQTAKIAQTAQYELVLEKTENWKIIDVE